MKTIHLKSNYQSNEKPKNRGLFSIRKKKPTKKPLQTIALFSSKSGSGCTHHAIALTKYLDRFGV